jgi:hypothetical protein
VFESHHVYFRVLYVAPVSVNRQSMIYFAVKCFLLEAEPEV